MNVTPAVVVKRGGFLSAIASGFFGLLITAVICGTGLASYGIYVLNERVGGAFSLAGSIVDSLPDWSEKLPPALADMLSDRRAADYRQDVDVRVRLADVDGRRGTRAVVFEVSNNGSETITMMAINVALQDGRKVPLEELRAYAATPVTFDEGHWRGPLLPGSTRTFSARLYGRTVEDVTDVSAEISELRIAVPTDRVEAAESLAKSSAE